MSGLLLDTHVWLWMAQGDDRLPVFARNRIDATVAMGQLYLSIISVWETGLLASKGRIHLPGIHRDWIKAALAFPGLRLLPLEPDVALDCNELPGQFHPDPADRILVASARHLGVPLMTRDKKIIAYGQQGHVLVDAI
jgi:PIN domain nuclease of toxin-antitoxin system